MISLESLVKLHQSAEKQTSPIADMNPKNDSNGIRDVKGLSGVVQFFLGKPLNKSQQLSDWNSRPLSDQQLEYAALDAHCMLNVASKICRDADSWNEAQKLVLRNLDSNSYEFLEAMRTGKTRGKLEAVADLYENATGI